MRVGVVDIGTNSTRLLVCDVEDAGVTDVVRRTQVTRLGQELGARGSLHPDAKERVFSTLAGYRAELDELRPERTVGVLTSAVRDAADGAEFTREIGERFGIEARTISGEEEGRLTFLGATAERPAGGPEPVAVVDVGGGSTEVVIGAGGRVSFFVSVHAGVVRQTERFLAHDPPEHDETQALAEDVRALFAAALPGEVRREVATVIGVAGTATSVAAIDLALDPYDPDRVEGFRAPLGTVEELLARLATMDEDERREVVGLHPDRAATIIAGMVILLEALRALGVDEFEVSEHDILRGAALMAAGRAPGMNSG